MGKTRYKPRHDLYGVGFFQSNKPTAKRRAVCRGYQRARFPLPPSAPDESHDRVGQPRFYPLNVDSEKKRLEKLDDMHHNPVQRGLVSSPLQGPGQAGGFMGNRRHYDASVGQALLAKHGMVPSMSRSANPYDDTFAHQVGWRS